MGAWLQREREERRVSLTTVTTQTHINDKYLRAIEDDRFDLIPSQLLGGPSSGSMQQRWASRRPLSSPYSTSNVRGVTVMNGTILAPTATSSVRATGMSTTVGSPVLPVRAPVSHRAANALLGLVEAVLPKRLAHEELGDALEYVAAHPQGWRPVLKIVYAIWTGVNAVRQLRAAVGRKGG